MVGLAFSTHHMAATHRAALRKMKFLVAAGLVLNDLDYFGNHVAAALHHDPIADLDAQPLNFIFIVQCGPADRSASDWNRSQPCHWGELAGASYLHLDVLDLRGSTAGRVFVSDGPTRGLTGESQPLLQPRGVYLDDDSVNLVCRLL